LGVVDAHPCINAEKNITKNSFDEHNFVAPQSSGNYRKENINQSKDIVTSFNQ
jgi:hypothetical protein